MGAEMPGGRARGADEFSVRVAALVERGCGVVLLDGRSGSGKTTLADELAAQHPSLQVVHLDAIYPGWDGLDAGSRHVVDYILDPIRPRWLGWDWEQDSPSRWFELDPARPVLVEGVGSLSRASRPRAELAGWVEAPDELRRRRALERDGQTYAPHWDRWAAQELRFIDRERPQELADVVITEES